MRQANLAKNVRRLRKKVGYTQDQLAERANIPRATMAGVEKASSNPTLSVIAAIADALGVSIDELLRTGDPRATLVKFNSQQTMSSQDGKYQSASMSPVDAKHVIIQKVTMKPGALYPGKPHGRGSQEFLLSVKGTAHLTVVDSEFVVEEGDLCYYSGDQKHTYENRGQETFEGVSFIYYPSSIED